MSDIKIFVSSRIDVQSYSPDNAMFVPVRCGAAYDKSGDLRLGDDTGLNISQRRMSFNELTVQYWAWKNTDADYYGLCHYRRFLNFSKTNYPENYHCQVEAGALNEGNAKKYELTEKEQIQKLIETYDVVVPKECPVKNIPSPFGYPDTVYDLWNNHSQFLLVPDAISILMESIKEMFPSMYQDAREYMGSESFRGYNCFVMKKHLFEQMCDFEFTVLFDIEKKLDLSHATATTQRTCGYLSEILFSIFIYHLQKKHYKIKELQLLVFEETRIPKKMELDTTENHIVVIAEQHKYSSAVVFISSLARCAKKSSYRITFVERDLLPQMRAHIRAACAGSNVQVDFFDPMPILLSISEKFKDAPASQWSFVLPWIIDDSIEKVLHLDADAIILEDIAELYSYPLEGKLLGAIKDLGVQKALNNPLTKTAEIMKGLGIKNPYLNFSDTVLLMNLGLLRKKLNLNCVLRVLFGPKSCENKDVWNVFVESDSVLYLDYKWGVRAVWGDALDEINDLTPITEKEKWNAASKNPAILVSNIWRNPDSPLAHYFWDIARRTDIYERILCEMIDIRSGASVASGGELPTPIDGRTGVRKVADKILPKGTRRREFAKKLLPKGSLRWRFCKQIYYIFKPQYRPQK